MKKNGRGDSYTVSDGKLVLLLEEAPEGGFLVRSPMDSELLTEADSIHDAFLMARDALKSLAQSRAKLLKRMAAASRRSLARAICSQLAIPAP